MRDIEQKMRLRAAELLKSGEVVRVIGWTKGEFCYDPSPAVFEREEELSSLVYNGFCGANLSKYLIEKSKGEGKSAVFLKPCDTYSFNQLLKENRIVREKIYVIGVECQGKIDVRKLKEGGMSAITDVKEDGETITASSLYGDKTFQKDDALLERCLTCKSKEFVAADEKIVIREMQIGKYDRFAEVEKLERMTEDERFAFWREQLSKCIRCNACRNVCPACSCIKCVFDNAASGVAAKANESEFGENLFHIVRAYHVAGRCTDCGECSRVCPQSIPLHLLNRKFIKELNTQYGEYQAGESADGRHPLIDFKESDPEAKDVVYKEKNE